MSVTLGSAFPVQRPDPEPLPDTRLELILAALASLRDSLTTLPAPQVTIDAPDLSAIVNAVNSLRPGVVDPREIGEAVANALIPGSPAYTFGTAAAIGTTDIQRPILATPLKTAVANTATTIVAPVVTGSFWRIVGA